MDFERNSGMERITMEEGTAHNLIKEAKPPQAGAAVPELRPKFVKVVMNTQALADFKPVKKSKKASPAPEPEPVVPEPDPEPGISVASEEKLTKTGQVSSIKSILDNLDEPKEKKTVAEEEEEDEGVFDNGTTKSSSESSSSRSSSSSSSQPAKKSDDDEEAGR
jgi:hypothetical protein